MPKEPYVKPEVRSEEIEAGALGHFGSGGGQHPWLQCFKNPSCGFCCEDD